MFYVYVLKSKEHGKFYIGVTRNIVNRLSQHNSGAVRSTKPYKPWMVVYTEVYKDKNLAYKREYYLKGPSGYLDKKAILSKLV